MYKIIVETHKYSFEKEINKLAEDGYVLKSASISHEGEDNSNETFLAIMKYEFHTAEEEIIQEIRDIYEKIPELNFKSIELKLDEIIKELRYLRNNS